MTDFGIGIISKEPAKCIIITETFTKAIGKRTNAKDKVLIRILPVLIIKVLGLMTRNPVTEFSIGMTAHAIPVLGAIIKETEKEPLLIPTEIHI